MQNLARTFAFMLVVSIAAASAVVDAQTTNDITTAGNFGSVTVFTVPE